MVGETKKKKSLWLCHCALAVWCGIECGRRTGGWNGWLVMTAKIRLMELKMWQRQPLNGVYHIPPINYDRTTSGRISLDWDSFGLLWIHTVITTTHSRVVSKWMAMHVLFSLHSNVEINSNVYNLTDWITNRVCIHTILLLRDRMLSSTQWQNFASNMAVTKNIQSLGKIFIQHILLSEARTFLRLCHFLEIYELHCTKPTAGHEKNVL